MRDGGAIAPTHFAIVAIVDHEQWHPHAGGECRDVEILPGKAQPPLQPAAHRRHDRPIDAKQRFELRAVAVDVGRRGEEYGAADREPPPHRERGGEPAQRMSDDVADGPDRVHHGLRGAGEFRTRAEPARRCAVSRGIERHNTVPVRKQCVAEVNEAGAAAAQPWTSSTPGPRSPHDHAATRRPPTRTVKRCASRSQVAMRSLIGRRGGVQKIRSAHTDQREIGFPRC